MAESSSSTSPAINPDDSTPNTTPPQLKLTSAATLTEVLNLDLSKLGRSQIINLKKDVIADLAVYIINKPVSYTHLTLPTKA